MIVENISPEQRAKFMTANQIDSLGSPEKEKKQSKIFPIIYGILAAAIIVFAAGRLLINSGAKNILSPFVSKNSGLFSGPMVENPLNGMLYKEADAAAWKDARPLGVMTNNHVEARPQSGLIDADLVYEIVAEGGITRYLAFFLSTLPEKIGPVRSTREYYLVLVKELGDAMLMHIGYSPQALEAIETWPVRSLGRGGADFWRDQKRLDAGVAIEHTAYVSGSELRKLGDSLGWHGKREFESWKFKDDGPIDTSQVQLVGEGDKPIVIDFWFKGDYTGAFKYDRATNTYLRFTGYDDKNQLIPLLDQESQKQVAVKNVVVQFATETSIPDDEKHRLEYNLVGSGQAVVFLDGKAIKAIWKKESRDGRTKFYDTNGQEIVFNRGKIWVSIVPDRNIEQFVY
jgi:hypothetical protein